MYVWAAGPVVSISAAWTSPADPWQDETIATLPEGMRPPMNMDFPMCRNGNSGYGDLSLGVYADGSVRVRGHGGAGHQGDYIATNASFVSA